MVNNGRIVSAGGSGTFCGSCSNNGTMVLVASSWECAGGCYNDGVVVAVGKNCFTEEGGYLVNLCVDDVCYLDTN